MSSSWSLMEQHIATVIGSMFIGMLVATMFQTCSNMDRIEALSTRLHHVDRRVKTLEILEYDRERVSNNDDD